MIKIRRRDFIRLGGLSVGLGLGGFALLENKPRLKAPKRFVFLSLNGGLDALAVLCPRNENEIKKLRPKLFFETSARTDWDGYRRHPALDAWQELWNQKKLAFVHQVGVEGTKSHAAEQKYIQTLVRGAQNPETLIDQLMRSPALDLRPFESACYFTNLRPHFYHPQQKSLLVHPELPTSLGPKQTEIFQAYQSWRYTSAHDLESVLAQRTKVQGALKNTEMPTSPLKKQLGSLAQMINSGHPVQLAYIQSDGWDTHAHQGILKGVFQNHLEDLTSAVAQFATQIGDEIDNTLIFIASEFGRSNGENGSLGTEHGTGGLIALIGGGVRGGHIYGKWESLGPGNLPITTDLRDLWGHLQESYFELPRSTKRLGFRLF